MRVFGGDKLRATRPPREKKQSGEEDFASNAGLLIGTFGSDLSDLSGEEELVYEVIFVSKKTTLLADLQTTLFITTGAK